jgi:uncharacterized membrane protein YqhA
MSTPTPQPAKKSFYDDEGGIAFAAKFPPALRWVLIPVTVLATFIVMRFLVAWVTQLFHIIGHPLLGDRIASIVGPFFIYAAVVQIGAAMAPKSRLVAAAILVVLVVLLTAFLFYKIIGTLEGTDQYWLYAASVSTVLGAIGGWFVVRSTVKVH